MDTRCFSTPIKSQSEVVTLLKPLKSLLGRYCQTTMCQYLLNISKTLASVTMDCSSTHPVKQELLNNIITRYSNMKDDYMPVASTLLDRFRMLAFGISSVGNQATHSDFITTCNCYPTTERTECTVATF